MITRLLTSPSSISLDAGDDRSLANGAIHYWCGSMVVGVSKM